MSSGRPSLVRPELTEQAMSNWTYKPQAQYSPTGVSQLPGRRGNFIGQNQYEERLKRHADRYGQTGVVLSFGAANGGALFAQWLRHRLMEVLGYTKPNAIYLDTVALGDHSGTKLTMRTFRDPDTGRVIGGGLASMNHTWAEYYTYAMSQAHTMIFVGTAEWFRSPYCSRELNEYIRENQNRVGDATPLRGIALRFYDEPSPAFLGMKEIWVHRKYVVADPQVRKNLGANMANFWTLDNPSLYRVAAQVLNNSRAAA
jgi:hypothetical protein